MLNRSIPTKFDDHDMDQLNYLAKLYDRPVSYLIREATRAYLFSQTKKLEFIAEAKSSLENYKNTGLHCNNQEIKTWLSNLSNGVESERPQCHT